MSKLGPAVRPSEASLTLAETLRIDQICNAFENALAAGEGPGIEQYLAEGSARERPELLQELLKLEFDYCTRSGAAPDWTTYRARFPEAATLIDEFAGVIAEPHAEVGPLPFQLGRYRIEAELGRGAYGVVYLARDDELGRSVAVKLPRLEHAAPRQTIDRLRNEARATAGLDHPAIVPVYDVGQTPEGTPYLVMAHVAGQTLQQVLDSGDPWPLTDIAELGVRIADALAYAHRRGFVHRDLSPSNILIDEAQQPRLVDFGLALHDLAATSDRYDHGGSLPYMAPEQLASDILWLDGRADIWALGVILYRLLSGQLPFSSELVSDLIWEIQERPPKPIRQLQPAVPEELERICAKCLAKPLDQRYTTANDLAADLRRWLEGTATEIEPVAGRSRGGRRQFVVVALASLLFLGTAAVMPYCLPNRVTSAPLSGTLDVLVWNRQRLLESGVSIHEPGVLPLRAGDQIRLQARLNHAAFLYVVGIDARGNAIPLFPWRDADWRAPAEDQASRRELDLPGALGDAWPVEPGPAGMETFVVIASEGRLELNDLADACEDLQSQQDVRYSLPVCFENGKPVSWRSSTVSGTRGIDFHGAVLLEDGLLANQVSFAKRLLRPGRHLMTLSFCVSGEER